MITEINLYKLASFTKHWLNLLYVFILFSTSFKCKRTGKTKIAMVNKLIFTMNLFTSNQLTNFVLGHIFWFILMNKTNCKSLVFYFWILYFRFWTLQEFHLRPTDFTVYRSRFCLVHIFFASGFIYWWLQKKRSFVFLFIYF